MIYASVFADGHSNNSLFAESDPVHRFNPTYTPRLLRQTFLNHGIEINTPDLNQARDVAFELHFEARISPTSKHPKFLIALENPNINPLNADIDHVKSYDLVFAWDKRLFHLPNVVPILIPHPLPKLEMPSFKDRSIFSCLINANKAFKNALPTDLYLERTKVIRWYEKYALDDFHLYGMGWEKCTPAFTPLGRSLRALKIAKNRILGNRPFPSFKGPISDKSRTYAN